LKESLRKRVVEELGRNRHGFVSLSHLIYALEEKRIAVKRVMEHLVRLGAVQVIETYPRPPKGQGRSVLEVVYRTKEGLDALLTEGRKPATAWDRMWKVIRAISKAQPTFTRRDLAILAESSMPNAREFTKKLRKAGYLRQRQRGHWELVKDPGPVRPIGGRG
jgi:hypothetical protein